LGGARILRQFGDVCIAWELETAAGTVIPICEYFRVSAEKLKEIRPYYDPRPLTDATR